MNNCPFCNEKNIVFETEFWKVINNKYAFYYWVKHMLVFPKRHVLFSKDLTENEFSDYKNVENFMSKEFWDVFYFSFTRQSLWNRKVEHMHYHYITWNPQDFSKEWINYLEIK